ncbi:hypothetical protein FBZ84_114194 [Azospirillum baldaniorum]|uniref:hypothetical protein n=1 Tax=Azospirillum baldaniorum TaxID=1064539 RepID=UPI0011A4A409|nr:hypothetical protein [Azospirillum baldaniorum]TWA60613.1 hypothetical protein FBZ84_114194 [Azospirillum baldaniorum]
MTGSATYLLHSRVPVAPGAKFPVGAQLARRDREGGHGHATFVALAGDEVMELTAFASLAELPAVLAVRTEAERGVAPWLTGEWRHEILGHVEDVIAAPQAITAAPMVEMRHIEVPPPVYAEYRQWRERTIYEAVRQRSEIDDFRSYQSVLSTEPGVMFVVGFSAEPARYAEVYRTQQYQEILREAGSRYIAQGLSGLRCTLYARPQVAEELDRRAA